MMVGGLDLSSRTGVVVLGDVGEIIMAEEFKAKSRDTLGMIELARRLIVAVLACDLVLVEGFAYGAKGNAVDWQYGIGHVVRCELQKAGIKWREVSPGTLKKFSGCKGNAGKVQVAMGVYEKWGRRFETDNITDAYVLARMAHQRVKEE